MSKVRLGFIGAGWWATVNHMPQLKQRGDVEFAAVCRLGKEVLHQVQDEFGFAFATENYRELLAQPLDAVVIASPHRLHFEHAHAALEAGLHVMVEKPMALHAAEGWQLVELAQRKQRHLLIPYGWHYKPFVQTAKQWLDEVGVGKIEYVLCHMASPIIDLLAGNGDVPAQWTPTLAKPDTTTWQIKEYGGGYAHGQITHSAGLLFWLTGLRATTVSALISAPNSRVDMYNAANVRFDNGAIGVVSGAATLPDGSKYQVDLRIFGSEGVLLLDVERERVELRRRDGTVLQRTVSAGEGDYTCETPPHRFVELIQGNGRNDSPGDVAARSVELVDALMRSADANGAMVNV